jgi:hypothetical protein
MFLCRILPESKPSLIIIFKVLDVGLLDFGAADQVKRHQTIQVSDVRFQPIILLEKLLDTLCASILRGNVEGCVSSAATEIVAKQDSDSGRQFVIELHRIPILFILCCQNSVVTELKVEVLNHGVRAIDSDLISNHLKVTDWI